MTVNHATFTAARLWVVSAPSRPAGTRDEPRGQAYLSQALFRLSTTSTDAVPTMAVDEGWRVYANPEWLAWSLVPEVGRELCHMLWHLLNDHAVRARAAGVSESSAGRWRVATDMAINELTRSSGLAPSDLPIPLYDDEQACPTAEQMYVRLADETGGAAHERDHVDCGSGADGIPREYEPPPSRDLPTLTAFEANAVRRGVAQAVRAGEGGDAASSALRRWAESVAVPVVPWQQVLAGAVRRSVATVAGCGDYDYRRPSRRSSSASRILLPSQHRPVPRVAVVVDTSGSMSRRMLARALAELDGIFAELRMAENGIDVFTVDEVAYHRRVLRAVDVDLLGGGGTDMSVGIAAAAGQRPRPELTVVFTDGYTPWPTEPVPGMTVIAAVIGTDREQLPATPDWMVRVDCVSDD